MKILIVALTLTTLIAAPALIQSASAAPDDWRDSGQSGQNGSYKGYPLRDWYRSDSW
jgi:hypothetical protein